MHEIDETTDEQTALVAEVFRKTIEKKELFDLNAKMFKASLNALETNGFTREEAVLILAHQGPILMGNN